MQAGDERTIPGATYLGLGVLGLALMRRRGRVRSARATSAMLALLLLALLDDRVPARRARRRRGRVPTDWTKLPAATTADPELVPLGFAPGRLRSRSAPATAATASPRFCAAAVGDPRSGISPSCYALVGLADQRAFALTGNSTSLVANSVSAINPRLLVFPRVDGDLTRPATMTAVGFVRGEQFVEMASRDPSTGDFNFYLVAFEQKCSYASGGCDLASLLTEEIEHDWTAYSVYDQDDLEGTSVDCNSCHQPNGYGTKRILRMQELASPWLHWFPQRFVQRTDSDRVLLAQFTDAHKDDTQYGGIPIADHRERGRRGERRPARGPGAGGGLRRPTESVRRTDRHGDEERKQPDLAGALRGEPSRRGDRGPLPCRRRHRRSEAERRHPFVPGRRARRGCAREPDRHP